MKKEKGNMEESTDSNLFSFDFLLSSGSNSRFYKHERDLISFSCRLHFDLDSEEAGRRDEAGDRKGFEDQVGSSR